MVIQVVKSRRYKHKDPKSYWCDASFSFGHKWYHWCTAFLFILFYFKIKILCHQTWILCQTPLKYSTLQKLSCFFLEFSPNSIILYQRGQFDWNKPKVQNNQSTNSISAKLDTQNSQLHKAVEVGTLIYK